MLRLFVGCAALTLAVTACSAGDKKPEQTLKDLRQELDDALDSAKTEAAKGRVMKNFAGRFVQFAEKNPKDSDAIVALLIAVVNLPADGGKDSPRTRALEVLRKDYSDSKELGKYVREFSMTEGDDVVELLKEVLAKNPDRETRADALKVIIGNREQALADAGDAKRSEAVLKEIEAYRKRIGAFKDLVKDVFVGATVPEVQSKDLDGKEVKLSDLKGKVVVLDCWATWCPPCRAMIPHSRKLVGRLKGKPFAFVGVSFDDDPDTVKDFKSANPMPWTHWFNGKDGEIAAKLDVTSFPTIFVLDGKGVIRYRNVRGEALDKAVDQLLKEMEAEKGK